MAWECPLRRMVLRWLALWSLILSGCGLAAAAVVVDGAGDFIPLAGYAQVLEDPGGQLTLAEVRRPDVAASFRPARQENGQINFGYSASAYWLRLDFARQAVGDKAWLLEVAFPSLDSVDFYGIEAGGVVHHSTGDLLPFARRPFVHRNFVFPLQLAAGQESAIYLRVVSQGSLTLPLRLWQPERFRQHSLDVYALLSLYYGMLLALGLYNLLLYTSLRDRIYLYY